MLAFLRHFSISLGLTVAIFGITTYYLGFVSLIPLIILMVIEITFSFDNAVVNAKVLKKMSDLWQKLFLSVGIIIAIFGMRLVFPILIVTLTAGLSWGEVINLALNHPTEYAEKLEVAGPTITAFGGAFLLMLTLHFFMEDEKKYHWWGWFEERTHRLGAGIWWLPAVITAVVVGILAAAPFNHHPAETLKAGLIGLVTYIAIHGVALLVGKGAGHSTSKLTTYTGWAGLTMFLYLELLDASFSLDGVLGAFAITSDVILIVAGLGIGAVWVRSLTVYMVRRGTLEAYRYLEHGAHYAIAILAFSMLISAWFELPEAITGVLGLLVIAASIVSSLRLRKRLSQA